MARPMAVAASLVLAWGPAFAQNPPAKSTFDVVSIKPAPPKSQVPISELGVHGGPGTPDPEHFAGRNVSLRGLLTMVYGPLNPDQLSGPTSINTDWNIEAKVPAGTTKEQLNQMLLSMMENRFHLKLHRETRTVSGYNLVLAKGGLKLKDSVHIRMDPTASAGIAKSENNRARAEDEDARGAGGDEFDFGVHGIRPHSLLDVPEGPAKTLGGNMATMSQLARVLTGETDSLPVVDMTGLTGTYDLRLSFATRSAEDRGDASLPGLLPSLEHELGLKLEPTKTQIDVIVIDHVDSVPTEN
jgi:uncharacterized protein (TIGR03435 family)